MEYKKKLIVFSACFKLTINLLAGKKAIYLFNYEHSFYIESL